LAIVFGKDTFIICRNSQGVEIRATSLRLTRYLVVFEVYNPYSIIQLSEVLMDFKIFMNEKMTYSGRAVVSNLVNTGTILICEASLEDGWLDVDIFSSMFTPGMIRSEFGEFLKEWDKIHQVGPEFKVIISDLQTFLADLRRWLDQVELGVRSQISRDKQKSEMEVIKELEGPVFPAIGGVFERFEIASRAIPEELQMIHRAYGRRQIHPHILCSPFVYRVFHKPLGYAGDYEMVNMMIRDPFEGSSLFAKVLNYHFLSQAPCEAHRNRIIYLVERLREETLRMSRQGKVCKIFNLGCGPAWEVQRFLVQDDLCEKAQMVLMDFNDETLTYTTRIISDIKMRHRVTPDIQLIKKSVNQILKEATREGDGEIQGPYYDYIYCAGLFDYLSDRICKKLLEYFYAHLAPGGLLVATNVDVSNPIRGGMECFLEWHLVYRDKAGFLNLKPEKARAKDCQVTSDVTGVNIFMQVRKPETNELD
jgi:extracellular factor (EF) 3-hydroxypalmitic acid methyl ester biosynthesis protein